MIKAEPFKIKMVEPIRLIPREERKRALEGAGYNLFALKAEEVYIDLLTDSGTGAMSDNQWAGIMLGDESYAGSRNFYNLCRAVEDITGYSYTIPTHQGRGAEQVLFPLLIKKGQYVLGNMHFDTTRAHIGLAGGQAMDFITKEALDTSTPYNFKGNFDVPGLESFIVEKGPENMAFILITVTCNGAGGQPVSMDNIRQVAGVGKKHGVRVFIDAARYAENAYFIKLREKGYELKTIVEIIKEMFSYSQGFTMSAKKDALVNMGGILAFKDDVDLYNHARSMLVPLEGFPTYGGLAGRDMEALARGLWEGIDEAYLEYRIAQVAYLGEKLISGGIPIQNPPGGMPYLWILKKCCPIYLPGSFRPRPWPTSFIWRRE